MKKYFFILSFFIILTITFVIFINIRSGKVPDNNLNKTAATDNRVLNIDPVPVLIDGSSIKETGKPEGNGIDSKKDVLNLKDVKKDGVSKLIDKFASEKLNIKNPTENLMQISENIIVSDQISHDQCILNLVTRKSNLNVCDFVKKECDDLDCEKYECDLYKNNWFKVAYYGQFVGSGDKELISIIDSNVVIANLECGDKSLENYDNKLFMNLVN